MLLAHLDLERRDEAGEPARGHQDPLVEQRQGQAAGGTAAHLADHRRDPRALAGHDVAGTEETQAGLLADHQSLKHDAVHDHGGEGAALTQRALEVAVTVVCDHDRHRDAGGEVSLLVAKEGAEVGLDVEQPDGRALTREGRHRCHGSDYVFAYASLAAASALSVSRRPSPGPFVADLHGYARHWGVAMDNRLDLPGYKYYADEAGRRPELYVAFLNVASSPAAVTNGVCVPVDAPRLEILDRRERNYVRVDVSDRVDVPGARVWTYVGSRHGRERFRRGVAAGTAVVHDAYLREVAGAFARLGPGEYGACRASLCPGALPVRSLTRHDLP